jgi:AAA15 family ATPase/GTPase
MKISIENFKSIKKLHRFEIKPFTVLSGVNSAGKSSFVQLLLLLKQTLEKSSTDDVFRIEGDYYSIKNVNDVFYEKEANNKINFGLTFNKSEFSNIKFPELGIDDYEVDVSIAFLQSAEKIIVSDFEMNIDYAEREKEYALKLNIEEDGLYKVESDSDLYGKGLMTNKLPCVLGFVAFYPLSYEVPENKSVEKRLFTIDWLKEVIDSIFSRISYIGPARIEPKEDYLIPKAHNDVGKSGEFVSQILKEQANNPVSFRRFVSKDNRTEYSSISTTKLLDAVKYWMCNVFDVAYDIYSE